MARVVILAARGMSNISLTLSFRAWTTLLENRLADSSRPSGRLHNDSRSNSDNVVLVHVNMTAQTAEVTRLCLTCTFEVNNRFWSRRGLVVWILYIDDVRATAMLPSMFRFVTIRL